MAFKLFFYCVTVQPKNMHQVPDVQRVDNTTHHINHFPKEKCYQSYLCYPIDTAAHPLNNWGQDNREWKLIFLDAEKPCHLAWLFHIQEYSCVSGGPQIQQVYFGLLVCHRASACGQYFGLGVSYSRPYILLVGNISQHVYYSGILPCEPPLTRPHFYYHSFVAWIKAHIFSYIKTSLIWWPCYCNQWPYLRFPSCYFRSVNTTEVAEWNFFFNCLKLDFNWIKSIILFCYYSNCNSYFLFLFCRCCSGGKEMELCVNNSTSKGFRPRTFFALLTSRHLCL